MTVAWIAGVAVVLLVMLVSSNVKIGFSFIREKDDDKIELDVRGMYGLVRKRVSVPVIKFNSLREGIGIKTEYVNKTDNRLIADKDKKITKRTIKEAFDNIQELLSHCFHFHEWLLKTLRHVRCTKIYWKTRVGVGDAADTALTAGMVWGLKTSLLGFLFRFIKLDAAPELAVVPHFNEYKFFTEVTCLAKIRFYHILLAGLRLFWRIVKVKGGLKTWQRVLFKTQRTT